MSNKNFKVKNGIDAGGAINKVTITVPANGSTLTLADGKTLTVNNTLTFSGTDSSTLNIGSGGTLGTAAFTATTAYLASGVTSLPSVTSVNGTSIPTSATLITSGGALGTPASATLTNATGLPVSGITFSTSAALGLGSIELGHASDTTISRVSAGVAAIEGVNIVTTSSTDTLTNKTLTTPIIGNFVLGYTTTATAAGTTTLTNTSNNQQIFTGTSTQTVVMPVASTMTVGTRYVIENNSTGNVTVNSSGSNLIATVIPGTSIKITNILASGTSAASWDYENIGFNTLTGTGANVLGTSPTISGLTLTGTLTAGASVGTSGQVLQSTATGTQWATMSGVSSSNLVFGPRATGGDNSTSFIGLGEDVNSGNGPGTNNAPSIAIGTNAASSASFQSYGVGIAIGSQSAVSSGGNYWIAIGDWAGSYQNTNQLDCDVFVGAYAGGSFNRSGTQNTIIGGFAGTNVTSGSQNTIIGKEAGSGGGGYNPVTGVETGSNNIVIGYQALPSTTSVSNQITLGNASISSLRCHVTSISGLSDERDKTNIKDLPIGIDFVNSLRPVKFEWNTRDESKVGIKDFGFIAQEVMEAEDSIDAHEWLALTLRDNEEKYELAPAKLVPILVKAIQDLSEEIKSLKNNNNLN